MAGILELIEQRLGAIEQRLAKCGPLPEREMPRWVDQRHSPLRSRKHCAATRRLVAEGDPRAFVNGRRHLMTEEAVAEEMARLTPPAPAGEALPSSASTYDRALAKALGQ